VRAAPGLSLGPALTPPTQRRCSAPSAGPPVHRSGLAARAAGLLDAAAPGGSLERGSAAARPMLRAPAAAIFRTCSSTFVILVLNNKFKTGTNFSWYKLRGKRVKTLSLQEPGRGQIQGTSWRDHTPFTTSTFTDIHASAQT